MPKPMISVQGPKPSRILFKLSKEGFKMIKDPIAEAGKDVQKRAKEWAAKGSGFGISGNYRKAIGRRTRAMKKEGEISATVGIVKRAPVIKYAYKVEMKHHVFTRLEHEFKEEVTKDVTRGIKMGLRNLKIRK